MRDEVELLEPAGTSRLYRAARAASSARPSDCRDTHTPTSVNAKGRATVGRWDIWHGVGRAGS
jgi:hypothetical protein